MQFFEIDAVPSNLDNMDEFKWDAREDSDDEIESLK